MQNGIMDDPELAAYAAQWDMESAAEELELDRVAQAYESGLLRPAEPVYTAPLPAFLILVLICLALIVALVL